MLKNKNKDMARSVLPSTRRKGARQDKRNVHKACRGRVRAALHDWDEDSTDELLDPQRYDSWSGIKVVVRDRRDADNLGPLMAWAKAKADDFGDTPAGRYTALRAVLPPGIIGWHAMSHVEHMDEFRRNPEPAHYFHRYDPAEAKRQRIRADEELCEALRNNIDILGKLNTELKRQRRRVLGYCDGIPVVSMSFVRLLAGVHDIEDFVKETKHREVVESFLSTNNKTKGEG